MSQGFTWSETLTSLMSSLYASLWIWLPAMKFYPHL